MIADHLKHVRFILDFNVAHPRVVAFLADTRDEHFWVVYPLCCMLALRETNRFRWFNLFQNPF